MFKVNFDTAIRLDIVVRAGDDFKLTINAKDADEVPIDFSGYSGRMQVKVNKSDSTSVLELTNTDFTFNNGSFVVQKDNTSMQVVPGKYYYDIELTDTANKVKTWFYGVYTVNEDVTR